MQAEYKYKVNFAKDWKGKKLAEVFLKSLPKPAKAKVARKIEMLKLLGPMIRDPDSKPLEDDIFELRVKDTIGAIRILYFFDEGNIVLLTNGFVKKQDKTPRAELTKAKRIKKLYLAEKKKKKEAQSNG